MTQPSGTNAAELIVNGRDYGSLIRAGEAIGADGSLDRDGRMGAAAAALWEHLGEDEPDEGKAAGGKSVSWIGFYEIVTPGHVASERHHGGEVAKSMVLGPHRPKPACSPIGLHGLCGRGWLERKAFAVADIRVLGEEYVACDPRDQSELVIPMLDPQGAAWGVLDADSYVVGAFTAADIEPLTAFCIAAGLTGRFDTEVVSL